MHQIPKQNKEVFSYCTLCLLEELEGVHTIVTQWGRPRQSKLVLYDKRAEITRHLSFRLVAMLQHPHKYKL